MWLIACPSDTLQLIHQVFSPLLIACIGWLQPQFTAQTHGEQGSKRPSCVWQVSSIIPSNSIWPTDETISSGISGISITETSSLSSITLPIPTKRFLMDGKSNMIGPQRWDSSFAFPRRWSINTDLCSLFIHSLSSSTTLPEAQLSLTPASLWKFPLPWIQVYSPLRSGSAATALGKRTWEILQTGYI